ncbi:Type II secretion system protein M [BD1-7 clade bacterium]|uniref:Type II secretion system protein M n=1 Tax=BD1-7 clade bacterium TaxID=2029982 RepID=A0A5S9QZJ4_9GAMM|nr:Type II secretion system protein M [BD1-7 clade bacterium]
MKAWFNALEKREQIILIGGTIAAIATLIFYFYAELGDETRLYQSRAKASSETLSWMESAVQTIQKSGGGGAGNATFANRSMSQLSQMAADRSNLRVTRFQPNGNDEAQVWFDRVAFNSVLDFLARLELDYGVTVETAAINSANSPGVVNARIKFSR